MTKEQARDLVRKWATSHINKSCSSKEGLAVSQQLKQVEGFICPEDKPPRAIQKTETGKQTERIKT